MIVTIGIDPGKLGGVAIIKKYTEIGDPIINDSMDVYHTPMIGKEYDENNMKDLLLDYVRDDTFVVIERAQAMPKQGGVSMFTFGMGYGIWLGIIAALDLSSHRVHSTVWTKCMLKGAPGEGKDRGIHVAKRLFPKWKPKLKKDLMLADAILLAEYGLRIKRGGIND